MNEDVENKVKGIITLYNIHKYDMNTVQRIALLTTWIEVSINKEEYEVAAGLKKELDKILNGEEEFRIISPSLEIKIQKEEEKNIIDPLESEKKPEKKKLKFVNYWGSGQFDLIRIGFNNFIIFNVGFVIK